MRRTRTTVGKRLEAKRKRIAPKNSRGLTESQILYRKRRKKLESYWKHEATLARRRA